VLFENKYVACRLRWPVVGVRVYTYSLSITSEDGRWSVRVDHAAWYDSSLAGAMPVKQHIATVVVVLVQRAVGKCFAAACVCDIDLCKWNARLMMLLAGTRRHYLRTVSAAADWLPYSTVSLAAGILPTSSERSCVYRWDVRSNPLELLAFCRGSVLTLLPSSSSSST